MAIKETIEKQIKEAMLAKQAVRLKALRQIKSEILKLETSGKPYTDQDEMAMLKRLVKQHHESIEAFEKGNRPQQVAEEKEELTVIESFLPAQVSHEELERVVKKAIAETGATSAKDMGKVMKHLQAKGVAADGKTMSEIVKKALG